LKLGSRLRLTERSALSQISVQATKLGGLRQRKSSYQVKPSKIKVKNYIVQERVFIDGLGEV
jgi:hypothetical protein